MDKRCDDMKTLTQDGFKVINLDSNFDGYLTEVDDGVFISAIESKNKGKGDFSRLVKQLKEKYKFIKIPTPSNTMREIAKHLGFTEKEEYFNEPFNEVGKVMFWSK